MICAEEDSQLQFSQVLPQHGQVPVQRKYGPRYVRLLNSLDKRISYYNNIRIMAIMLSMVKLIWLHGDHVTTLCFFNTYTTKLSAHKCCFMNEPEPSIWSNLQHNYKYLELNVYGDSNCEATCSIVT